MGMSEHNINDRGQQTLALFFRLFCGLLTLITDAARFIDFIKAATAEDIYDLRFLLQSLELLACPWLYLVLKSNHLWRIILITAAPDNEYAWVKQTRC
jgi:hypothetical protein